MSNGRNANHVTLPAVCRPFRFSIAATCSRFPSSTFAELAIMLAICFRLPAVGLFTLYFITAPSSLFQRQTDSQMILGHISHKQIIALSLFTRRRCVARSANYPGHGLDARSLQRNAIRRATDQSSVLCV